MAERELHGSFGQLVQTLPPFSLDSAPLPPAAADYLSFYKLDFSAEFPAARYQLGWIASGDHRLAVQCWVQPAATSTLLLVHGYFDHVGLFDHLIRFGLARGDNVVAFDLPGHGLSSGPRAEISDFAEYSQAITDVLDAVSPLPGSRSVLAQSTGGAAVMEYLHVAGDSVFKRVVLLAPLVRPHGWRYISFLHALLHRLVSQVERSFADNSQDPEFLAFVRQDPLQPRVIPVSWLGALRRWIPDFLARPARDTALLILQGDDDGTVDWRYNVGVLQDKFPAATIELIAGGRHHLANEDRATRKALLQRIEQYLAEPQAAVA